MSTSYEDIFAKSKHDFRKKMFYSEFQAEMQHRTPKSNIPEDASYFFFLIRKYLKETNLAFQDFYDNFLMKKHQKLLRFLFLGKNSNIESSEGVPVEGDDAEDDKETAWWQK